MTLLRPGLRARFALGLALLVSVVIAGAAVLVHHDQGVALRRSVGKHGHKVAFLLAGSLSEPLAGHQYQVVQELIESVAPDPSEYVVVMDEEGRVLAHSDAKQRGQQETSDIYAAAVVRHFKLHGWLRKNYEQEVVLGTGRSMRRYLEFSTRIQPGKRPLGYVRVGFDTERWVDGPIAATQQRLALIVMGGVLMALLTALLLSNLIIRPLNRLVEEAGILAKGRYDHALALDAPGELADLSMAFETMRKAIQHQVQTIEEANRQLDRKVFELETLYDVSRTLNFRCYSPELLNYILDVTLKALACEWGSLMLLSDDCDRLEVRMVRGGPWDEDRNATMPVGHGIAGRAFQTGELIIANEGSKDPRFEHLPGQESYAHSVRSMATVPLMVDNKPIGVLNVVNKAEGQVFTADDARLLTALAAQAARALESAKLYDQAIRESKTGLFVPTYFEARVQEQIIASRRFGQSFAIMILDVDHFKKVNDSYGHMVGDEVLIRVARFIKESLRTDIDIACRFGGEEFMVCLPRTDTVGAMAFCERLRGRIEAECGGVANGPPRVTASVGVAVHPEHGRDVATLKSAADAALYRAKDGGRNNVKMAPSADEETPATA